MQKIYIFLIVLLSIFASCGEDFESLTPNVVSWFSSEDRHVIVVAFVFPGELDDQRLRASVHSKSNVLDKWDVDLRKPVEEEIPLPDTLVKKRVTERRVTIVSERRPGNSEKERPGSLLIKEPGLYQLALSREVDGEETVLSFMEFGMSNAGSGVGKGLFLFKRMGDLGGLVAFTKRSSEEDYVYTLLQIPSGGAKPIKRRRGFIVVLASGSRYGNAIAALPKSLLPQRLFLALRQIGWMESCRNLSQA